MTFAAAAISPVHSFDSAEIGLPNFSVCVCVSVGYTRAMAAKDSGLRIRVERPLREAFLEACRSTG